MSEYSWKDALDQLKNCIIEDVPGIDREVYVCIKLCFDKLPKDAKSCLLLCSLFPEDAEIEVNVLFDFAIGSQLLNRGRNRVYAMVEILKSASLLLAGNDDGKVKLHDSIRDVARSVAAKDPLFMVVRRLSFNLGFQAPHKLNMLVIDHCNLDDISTMVSENLETLKVWGCNIPGPFKLPKLKYLQKLELLYFDEILMIPNALSSLSSLEELHIPRGLRIWLGDQRLLERSCVEISAELSRLNRLKILKIRLRHPESCPEENVIKNLQEFSINVGYSYKHEGGSYTSTKLVNFFRTQLQGAGIAAVQRAEEVNLRDVDGLPNGLIISKSEAFAELRKLHIGECDDMEHLTTIPDGKMRPNSMIKCFTNLSVMKISDCSSLIYLFCPYVAKCLVQLQELCIYGCPKMENIIRNDDQTDEEIIMFPKLKLLEMNYMKKLTSFYGKKREAASTSTRMDIFDIPYVQDQSLFDGTVALPSLEILQLQDLENVRQVWKEEYCGNNCFRQLKILGVKSCTELEVVIQPEILSRLQNLEKLHVESCPNLKYVFLPPTEMLYGLQNLQELHINNCNSLTYVLLTPAARNLVRLKQLHVFYCYNMKEIIMERCDDVHNIDENVVFPELESLKLTHLPHFTTFLNHELVKNSLLAELPFSEISHSLKSDEADICKGHSCTVSKVTFPNLIVLKFEGLRIGLNDMELSSDDFNSGIMSLKIHSRHELQLPSIWQLQNVEILHLANCWRHGLFKEFNPQGSFQRLKVLKVYHHRLSTLFSYTVFENLQQLEELELQNCCHLEEIIEDSETSMNNGKTLSFFRLTSIVLGNLPSLKDFGAKAIFACNLPALKVVKVCNCQLSTLFTCTVFKNLQQLEELEVSECRLLDQIVADDKTSSTEETTISLHLLKSLQLVKLPKLVSFSSSQTYTFDFPALRSFRRDECQKMNYFTNLQVHTPLLHVASSWNWGVSFSDLNEYIRVENDEEMFTIALKNIFELDT
ncbi:hypothetical protein ACET3Z_011594 [Daucus carota]